MLSIEFWTDNSLLSALEKCFATSFWPLYFWWETYCHLNWCFAIGNASLFSLADFKKFLIAFSFHISLFMICLDVNFFEFILFQVHSTSQVSLLPNLKFSAIRFSNIFQHQHSFLSSSGNLITWMLYLLLLTHRSLRPCSFLFQPFFFLLFRLNTFYLSILSVIDCFISNLLFNPSSASFISITVLLISKVSI